MAGMTTYCANSIRADQDVRDSSTALAQCCLEVIAQQFPHKLDHLIQHDRDNPLPSEIHPIFDGSYDWHSSVHMHWSLLRLRRLGVEPATVEAIDHRFDSFFRPELVDRELTYVLAPGRGSFERPYGWAWLLKLQTELDESGAGSATGPALWADALRPLSDELATRIAAYFAHLRYPIRSGLHNNTAFSMLLANDYARVTGNERLREIIRARALNWFGNDRDYPAQYEPGGADFLSPGLCEALLMNRVLAPEAFDAWWSGFAPADLAVWETPAQVDDRLDGHAVHLDGLNLSRAWCLRELAMANARVPRERLERAAVAHWKAAWPHVTGGDFVATHWLTSFALLR